LRRIALDLKIRGRRAIVCASGAGLGKGCAIALAEAGVDLIIDGRDQAALDATAAEIRRDHGVTGIERISETRDLWGYNPAGAAASLEPVRRSGELQQSHLDRRRR